MVSSVHNGRPLEVQVAVVFERLDAVRQELSETKAAIMRVEEQLKDLREDLAEMQQWRASVVGKAGLLSAVITILLNAAAKVFADRLSGK